MRKNCTDDWFLLSILWNFGEFSPETGIVYRREPFILTRPMLLSRAPCKEEDMDKLKELQEIIDQSQRIVFSVGQEYPTESNILIFGALMVFIASP